MINEMRDRRASTIIKDFFGDTCGFGINYRKPRVGKKKVPGTDASINFDLGNENENAFKARAFNSGIYFIQNTDIVKFIIRIIFKTFIMPPITKIHANVECYENIEEITIIKCK